LLPAFSAPHPADEALLPYAPTITLIAGVQSPFASPLSQTKLFTQSFIHVPESYFASDFNPTLFTVITVYTCFSPAFADVSKYFIAGSGCAGVSW